MVSDKLWHCKLPEVFDENWCMDTKTLWFERRIMRSVFQGELDYMFDDMYSKMQFRDITAQLERAELDHRSPYEDDYVPVSLNQSVDMWVSQKPTNWTW